MSNSFRCGKLPLIALILLVLATFISTVQSLGVADEHDDRINNGNNSGNNDNTDPELLVETVAVTGVASCNKHDHDQSFWPIIGNTLKNLSADRHHQEDAGAAAKPDAFVWLGDVIYADTRVMPGWWKDSSRALMKQKYEDFRENPFYKQFVESGVKKESIVLADGAKSQRPRILGVWDDHDFGSNDGGVEYKDKDYVQELFLDWLGAAPNDPRRKVQKDAEDDGKENNNKHRKGMYTFHRIPFRQTKDGRAEYESAMCVVLLDVRYFRDPISPHRTGDMLGEAQWQWFRDTLRNEISDKKNTVVDGHHQQSKNKKKCLVTLIGSGVQVLPDTLPTENWGNFRDSRNRLIHEINQAGAERVIFLSGDVHFGELVLDNTTEVKQLMGGYPAMEMTTSGLTHSSGEFPPIRYFFDNVLPSPRRYARYLFRNFGSVELQRKTLLHNDNSPDREKKKPTVTYDVILRVHRIEDGKVVGELRKPVQFLERSTSSKEEEPTTSSTTPPLFPDSEYPPIKKALLYLKNNFFPNLRLHQVIYMVIFGGMGVGGLVVVGCVVVLGRCVWRCVAGGKKVKEH